MRLNGIRALWARGEAALNGWLSIGDGFAAEIVATGGYDPLTIDLQHGMVDDGAAVDMLQAVRASEATPPVRVSWLAPISVMNALDMGAHGVICPMVETAAQAAELVSHLPYPPAGTRSFGPTRAAIAKGPEIVEAIHRMLGAAKGVGIRAALHCSSPAYAAKAVTLGFDLVTLPNDVRILARAAAADVAETRAAMESGAGPG